MSAKLSLLDVVEILDTGGKIRQKDWDKGEYLFWDKMTGGFVDEAGIRYGVGLDYLAMGGFEQFKEPWLEVGDTLTSRKNPEKTLEVKYSDDDIALCKCNPGGGMFFSRKPLKDIEKNWVITKREVRS